MMCKKNKKGIIKISRYFLDNFSYDELSEYLKDIIVLNVELDTFIESHTYYCVSKYFDECKEGEVIPEYVIEIEVDENGDLLERNIIKL